MSLLSTPNEETSPSQTEPNNSDAFKTSEQMQRRPVVVRNVLYIIFICLSYYSAWWIYTHGQELVDFVRYRTYTPNSEVVALADKTDMSSQGRYLFYVSDPKISQSKEFNQYCGSFSDEEHTAVLGCYRFQHIYLYNVTDQRLYGIKEVTAAHEMLHAAYERMPIEEKLEVNRLIQEELIKLNNPRLREVAELYSRQDSSIVWNEMHSILGTEQDRLSPELESHYKQYFYDRKKVVGLSEAYEGVFTASKQRLNALDDQLADLKKQIDAKYAEIKQRRNQLTQEANQLDILRAKDISQYNVAVPGYNTLVNGYNAVVFETRNLVNRYNALVEQRNAEATVNNDLYKSLDSQEVQTVPGT